jgi:hypothetical protein
MYQSQSSAINTRPRAQRIESLTTHRLPRPTQWLQLRDHPGLPRRLGSVSVLTSRPKFVSFGLYQERWHGLLKNIPTPGQGYLQGASAAGVPRLGVVFLLIYPLGSCTAPLPPFRVVPIASLPILFDQSLLYDSFNFAFHCSIYWELALMYFKPGRAYPKRVCFYILCIAQLTTLISVATTHIQI